MNYCCVESVPPDGTYRALGRPVAERMARRRAGLNRSIKTNNQTPGGLEEQILQRTQGLARTILEEATQKKAD